MSSHAGPSNLKRSSRHFDNDEYIYIPSENEETEKKQEEQEELEYSDTELLHLPNEQHYNKNNSTKKVKRRTKATAKVRKNAVQQEPEKNESGFITVTSSIPESEVPKKGSFVWRYFIVQKT